ncbi:hypothetical protein SCA6_002145, partial [Theobroma cacao]
DAGNCLEAVAMRVALEWEREKTRVMKESLRDDELALLEKALEHSMLMGKKEETLAEIELQEKLIDDFMVFIGAVENNDVEIAQNFDEKAMMDAIVAMLNSDGNSGRNGEGLGGAYGKEKKKAGITILTSLLKEQGVTAVKAAKLVETAAVATVTAVSSVVGANGGSCDGDHRKLGHWLLVGNGELVFNDLFL